MGRGPPPTWRPAWAQLTEEDVRLIRALRDGPKRLTYAQIAEKFETTISIVHRAAMRLTYRWVT